MKDVAIVAAARTPIENFGGALTPMRAIQPCNIAIAAAVKKAVAITAGVFDVAMNVGAISMGSPISASAGATGTTLSTQR